MQQFPFALASTEWKRQYIRDLLVAGGNTRLSQLKDLYSQEQDTQIKYELRKAIHELEALEKPTQGTTSEDLNSDKLRRALQSDRADVLQRAFVYCVQNKIVTFLPEMEGIATKNPDPLFRVCLVRLKALVGFRYHDDLVHSLSDSDSRVISAAIEGLGTIGATQSLVQISRYLEDPSPRVKSAAVKVLADLQDQRAIVVLEMMVNSDNPAEREAAAHSLCVLARPAFFDLISKLLADSLEGVRTKAMRALEVLADTGHEQSKALLENQRKFSQQLIKDVTMASLDTQLESDPALFSDYAEIRIAALQKIAHSNASDSTSRILARLNTERDSKVIATGVTCLAVSAGDSAHKIRFLMNYLSSDDDRIRANAVESLAPLLDDDKLGFLIPYLSDENNRVRGNVIMAICARPAVAHQAGPQLLASIKALAEDSRENYQLTAVYCLGTLRDPQWADILDSLLLSRYDRVRDTAKEALTQWVQVHTNLNLLHFNRIRRQILPDMDTQNLPSREEVLDRPGRKSRPAPSVSIQPKWKAPQLLFAIYGIYGIWHFATVLPSLPEISLEICSFWILAVVSAASFIQLGLMPLHRYMLPVFVFATVSEFLIGLGIYAFLSMEGDSLQGMTIAGYSLLISSATALYWFKGVHSNPH